MFQSLASEEAQRKTAASKLLLCCRHVLMKEHGQAASKGIFEGIILLILLFICSLHPPPSKEREHKYCPITLSCLSHKLRQT